MLSAKVLETPIAIMGLFAPLIGVLPLPLVKVLAVLGEVNLFRYTVPTYSLFGSDGARTTGATNAAFSEGKLAPALAGLFHTAPPKPPVTPVVDLYHVP